MRQLSVKTGATSEPGSRLFLCLESPLNAVGCSEGDPLPVVLALRRPILGRKPTTALKEPKANEALSAKDELMSGILAPAKLPR